MKTIAVKIVILGAQGVGKTSLVSRYETKSFSKSTSSTIGASFSNLEITIDDTKIKMQVWDTAGQERFRSMAPLYYRGANAALLVFDLTNYETFTDVMSWAHELTNRLGDNLMMVVVGNKTDLVEQRVVDACSAQQYAASIGASFVETSALDSTGVQEMFSTVATQMMHQAKTDTESTLRVYSSDSKNESSGSSVRLRDGGGQRAREGGCC